MAKLFIELTAAGIDPTTGFRGANTKHNAATKIWTLRSKGVHLNVACELLWRWLDNIECNPNFVAKLDAAAANTVSRRCRVTDDD